MAADRNLILQLLITAQNQASQELENLRERLNEVGDGADSAGQRTQILQDALGELASKVGAAVAFGALAQQFVEANREADKLAKQFRAMTGDTEAAAHEIEFLRTVADRWGTTVGDIAPAYLRLAAAVKGTTAEGEPARKMIDDLTAAYINAGQSVEDMEEVMEIMGEAFAEGRVSIDDLREGMQEDMPPAIQAATTAILENNAALQKMLESGDAATDEFMPAFAAALREHIGGSATTIDTVDAAFSRLTARTKDLFVKIDDVIPLMSLYDGTLKSVASAGTAVVNVVDLLVDGLALVGNTVGAAAGALVTGGDALEAVGEQARLSGESMAATVTHMAGLKTATEEAAERQKQMQAELQAVADAADPYAAALRTVTQDLADAQAAFEQTGDAAALTATALETFLKIPEKRINSEGVLALAAALKVVGDQAEDSGQTISNTLGQELAKLTDEQLTRLEAQARDALAAASDGSEEGRKAFAELGQIIEGVVLARLERLGVDGPEALTGISTAAKDAMADFAALAEHGELSADTIDSAFDGVLARLDNPKELEAFKQSILTLGATGEMTGEQVERALLLIRQRLQETASDPAFAALEQALARLRGETERGIETGNKEQESLQGRIQAAIELAKARGDEAEAARLAALASQDEIQRSERRIQQLQRQQKEIDRHIQQLYAQANADGVYTDAERETIAALQDKSAAVGREISQIKDKLPLMQREADQVRRMAGPLGELTRLYQDQTRELEREKHSIDATYAARIAEQRSIEQVALAKGDEVASSQAAIKILELEADLAEKKAALAQQEADQAQKNLALKTLELLADGALSEADQQQLADLQALAEGKQAAADASSIHAAGMRGEADAAGGASSVFDEWKDNIKIFGDYAADAAERLKRMNKAAEEAAKQRAAELKAQGSWVSSIINGWTQRLGDLSEASEETFRKVALDADATRKSIAGATDATNLMRIATMNLAAGGIITWANKLAIQALKIELSFKGQAQSADRLSESLEKMADEGGVTAGAMAQLVRQAEAAKTSFNLLDQERLDRLQAAIDDVNDKLRQMQYETEDARARLAEMNAELLEAQGLDAKAELLRQQLDYQQALADIEAQRQDAELSGNRELIMILNEQRKVLEQINRTKIANIEADAAEQAQSRSNTTTTPTNNVTPINRAGGGKTYNLNLVGVRGQTLSATTDTDPTAFLDAIEAAQRVT